MGENGMSEKRFFTKINKNGRLVIIDKECHIELIDLTLACEVLNRLDLKLKTYNEQLGEQQATIEQQENEIEKLKVEKQMLEKVISNNLSDFKNGGWHRIRDLR